MFDAAAAAPSALWRATPQQALCCTLAKAGGMAEWSMAVVLKTSRIGYDVVVISCRRAARADLQYPAIFLAF
jgi:hypothetical protein